MDLDSRTDQEDLYILNRRNSRWKNAMSKIPQYPVVPQL